MSWVFMSLCACCFIRRCSSSFHRRATTRVRPYYATKPVKVPPQGDHKGSPLLCYEASWQAKSSTVVLWQNDDAALHFLSRSPRVSGFVIRECFSNLVKYTTSQPGYLSPRQ